MEHGALTLRVTASFSNQISSITRGTSCSDMSSTQLPHFEVWSHSVNVLQAAMRNCLPRISHTFNNSIPTRYTQNMPYVDKILARVKELTSVGTAMERCNFR
jgi:hypothetical protein